MTTSWRPIRARARRVEKLFKSHTIHSPDLLRHLGLPLALLLSPALCHEAECGIRRYEFIVHSFGKYRRDCGANQADGVFGVPHLPLGVDQRFEMPPFYLRKLHGCERVSIDFEGKNVAL